MSSHLAAARHRSDPPVQEMDRSRRDLFHLDPTWLCLRLLWNDNFQHAETAGGLNVLGIHGIGQDEASVKSAKRTLDALLLRTHARQPRGSGTQATFSPLRGAIV